MRFWFVMKLFVLKLLSLLEEVLISMFDFFWNLGLFIFVLGILVIVYEYGYFWVVCKVGVKVLCFLIGFGKLLIKWYDK